MRIINKAMKKCLHADAMQSVSRSALFWRRLLQTPQQIVDRCHLKLLTYFMSGIKQHIHLAYIRARETFSGWPPFLSKWEQRTLRVMSDVGDSLSGWWRVCHFDTPSLCFRYCLCHDVRHRSELGRNWEVETLTALSPPLLAAAGKLEPVPSEAEAASSTEL